MSISIDNEYLDPHTACELLEDSEGLREEIKYEYESLSDDPVDKNGSQIHPRGVPPQFFGDYHAIFDYINDVSAIIQSHTDDYDDDDDDIDDDDEELEEDADDGDIEGKETGINTDGTERNQLLSRERNRRRLIRMKESRNGLLQRELEEFLIDGVLNPFTQAMYSNPVRDERFSKKSDLPRFKFRNLRIVTRSSGTRPVNNDISVAEYKAMTPPKYLDKCIVCVLEIKEAYESTFSAVEMKKLRTESDISWDEWNLKEPWLTCYRFNMKRRIGEWLLAHKERWENTLEDNTCRYRCFCRDLIE